MTDPQRTSDSAQSGAPVAAPRIARRWWPIALVPLALVFAIAMWIRRPATEGGSATADATNIPDPVRVVGPGLIAVAPDSPLVGKLELRQVASERISAPLLTVTGSIVARLGRGLDSPEARWDFGQLELATMYADWLRARSEEPYTEQQLAKTRQLVAARVSAQTEVVNRLRKLVSAGTDAPKDLAKAEADLVEAQLDGQKQVYEAEAAWKNAGRSRATLQRQLFQQGADPELLTRAQDDTAIMVGDVPEARMDVVHTGQAAEARFYAKPGRSFAGHVSSVAPTVSNERRTLRVFFELADPDAQLRPGMFAEVGLGTEPRAALLVPADAVLHVGRSDYVLVQQAPGTWRATPVQVGEAHGPNVEVLSGVTSGDTIVAGGAILLKPLLVQALQA